MQTYILMSRRVSRQVLHIAERLHTERAGNGQNLSLRHWFKMLLSLLRWNRNLNRFGLRLFGQRRRRFLRLRRLRLGDFNFQRLDRLPAGCGQLLRTLGGLRRGKRLHRGLRLRFGDLFLVLVEQSLRHRGQTNDQLAREAVRQLGGLVATLGRRVKLAKRHFAVAFGAAPLLRRAGSFVYLWQQTWADLELLNLDNRNGTHHRWRCCRADLSRAQDKIQVVQNVVVLPAERTKLVALIQLALALAADRCRDALFFVFVNLSQKKKQKPINNIQ